MSKMGPTVKPAAAQAFTKPTQFSNEAKLDEFETLGVKSWFEKDLESKNNLVLEAKLKGESGYTKTKVTLDPSSQKDSLSVSEEVEVSASIHPKVIGQFKLNSKELSAHLDFNHHDVAGYWFNPYLKFKHARAGGVCKDGAFLNLGGITNGVNKWGATVRHQFELAVALNKAGDQARNLQMKHNLRLNYKQYGFHYFTHVDVSGKPIHHESKLAFSSTQQGVDDYLQVDLDNKFKPKNVSLGLSYGIAQGAKLYLDLSKPVLADKAFLCPVGTELSVGASYAHAPTGLTAKLGYFHGKRIASQITYGINKNFKAALSFDVRYC
jgi:hypothetical protein